MQRKSIDWFLYGRNMEKMYLEIFFAYRDLIRLSSVMLPLLAVTWVFGVFRMVNNDKFSKYMFHVFNIVQVSIQLLFNLLSPTYGSKDHCLSKKFLASVISFNIFSARKPRDVFRNQSNIYDGTFLQNLLLISQKSSLVDIRLGSIYAPEI